MSLVLLDLFQNKSYTILDLYFCEKEELFFFLS